MTELKTLKDIAWELGTISEDHLDQIDDKIEVLYNYKNQIRQEAIKWIKEMKKADNQYFMDEFLFYSRKSKIDWIKHFFNITDEDLK